MKLRRIHDAFKKHHKELISFWKYAILSKLHFWRYKSNKVIMLRLDLIGDCTMFSSVAVDIRKLYSDRSMTVVCINSARQVFERIGVFDKIISVDFRPENIDFVKLKELISEIRTEKYDILLQPQTSKLPIADIIGAAVKCNERIAVETKPGNSSESWVKMVSFLYDRFLPIPHGNVSEFDYFGAFVRGLGFAGYKTKRPKLPYNEQNFIEGRYYVLYPGGSFRQKFWPADRFAQIANYIYQITGFTGVILGAEKEKWVAENLKKALNPQTSMAMIDLTGLTTIGDVINIIGNAEMVVSNDTSGVHIACATNTPSIGIVGGWHFKRFLPYHIEDVKKTDNLPLYANVMMPCYYCQWDWEAIGRKKNDCLLRRDREETFECIDCITVDQVKKLVDKIVSEHDMCEATAPGNKK